MNDDLIPCHVTVRPLDGVVSVQMLLDTSVGMAIMDGEPYKRIGQIKKQRTTVPGRNGGLIEKDGFQWYFDEQGWQRDNGWESTRVKAIARLLLAGGYREAPANAINPGLF